MRAFLLFAAILVMALPVRAQGTQEGYFIDATGDDFTYYSLRTNQALPAAAGETGSWDVAFKGTTIKVNGGVAIVDAPFADVAEAPADGYATDAPDAPAIPAGSGDGWYNYNPSTHEVTPVENRTFVFSLASGRYAKFRVMDYYKQDFTEEGPRPVPRYYSFRFVLSEPDSRAF